jgi:AmiR/NasT family two-component response regulator
VTEFSDAVTEGPDQAEESRLLRSAVALAVRSIPACDYAGVSVLSQDEEITSAVVTDEIVLRCDDAQRELNEGPCVDGGWDGPDRLIADTTAEGKWPAFAARAAEFGVGSVLATRIDSGRTVACLNLYAKHPNAFDIDSRSVASAFAAHASLALASDQLAQHLRIAVESRQAIGQAVGILMERHKLDPDGAFDLLVRASQRGSVKLRDVAARVVEAGPEALS